MSAPLTRTITPKTRVLDAAKGLVEYIASDETLDSYREIIRADGWRFDERFESNPVFVDSHSYFGIADVLGKAVEWRVEGGKLIEVIQWAIDVEENHLARLGFQMTAKGYLKAVSVGFIPTRMVHRHDDDFTAVADAMKVAGEARDKVRTIYYEQQQIELSACVIGANPSALAKAFGAGDVSADLLKGCGLGSDEGQEMLKLAADAYESTTDEAVRKLCSITLRQFAGKEISAGRGVRGTATPQPGRGGPGGGTGQAPHERKRWLKQVADGIGGQN